MKTALTVEQSAELIRRGVSEDIVTTRIPKVNGRGFIVEYSPIFTLDNLLSLLPKEITITMDFYNVSRVACLHISATNERWYVSYKYEFEERDYWCKMFISENLIDALCKLLLWAIDHNHVKLD